MNTLTDESCDQLDAALDEAERAERTDAAVRAQAFSEGSDARLSGRPTGENPYDREQYPRWRGWLDGWRDVQRNWGAGVRGRWRIRTLPAVT